MCNFFSISEDQEEMDLLLVVMHAIEVLTSLTWVSTIPIQVVYRLLSSPWLYFNNHICILANSNCWSYSIFFNSFSCSNSSLCCSSLNFSFSFSCSNLIFYCLYFRYISCSNFNFSFSCLSITATDRKSLTKFRSGTYYHSK